MIKIINSEMNKDIKYKICIFGDSILIDLIYKVKNEKYGELEMKRVSETNVHMSKYIIYSYKNNDKVEDRCWLKGLGKEMLLLAVIEMRKNHSSLLFLEGKVRGIENIRNDVNTRDALIMLYKRMGGYIVKESKLYTEMETKLDDVIEYCIKRD